jgi:hypothetical protein
MPEGEDKVRPKYYQEGRTHPHRSSRKKTGFEGNNWPSTRTFYSDVPLYVIELSKRFQFYLKRSGLDQYYLEIVSFRLNHYVSNYTLNGMMNKRWGIRHRPKSTTILAIEKLTEWLIKACKKAGTYEPFHFKFDDTDVIRTQPKPNEKESTKRRCTRKEKIHSRWIIEPKDETIRERGSKPNHSRRILRVNGFHP